MLKIDLTNLGIDAIDEHKATSIQQEYTRLLDAADGGFDKVLDSGNLEHPDIAEINRICSRHRETADGTKIKNFVVLGTGGSCLGAETLISALAKTDINFFFLDNNDADWFMEQLAVMNPQETLFYVVSKSGNTVETLTQYFVALEWISKNTARWQDHFIFCTDPNKGDLRQYVRNQDVSVIDHPVSVGGRFAVLTPVGMLPAAFAGLSVEHFLEGARYARFSDLPAHENPCLQLAHGLAELLEEKPISVLLPYSSKLRAFSKWFCQLWAESLGKDGHGFTPYAALGTTDQHSQIQLYMEGPRDKTIGFVEIETSDNNLRVTAPAGTADLANFQLLNGHTMHDIFQAELYATRRACTEKGVVNYTIAVEKLDERTMGALFYFWESVTVYASCCIDVYPYNQPGVELGKKLTKEKLTGH